MTTKQAIDIDLLRGTVIAAKHLPSARKELKELRDKPAAVARAIEIIDEYSGHDEAADVPTMLADLVADLAHFADVAELDWIEILKDAASTYEKDRGEWDA